MLGGVVSDMQPYKKELPIVFTEFGMIGGVVSDVQRYKKQSPILMPENIPNSNSMISSLFISTFPSKVIDEKRIILCLFPHTRSISSFLLP
jgi:hypothetical protein